MSDIINEAEIVGKVGVGEWTPRQLKIRIGQDYVLSPDEKERRNTIWKAVKKKFFDGNTIRICGSFPGEENILKSRQNLILNVHRSKYKDGFVVGYLGFTMIPITIDGYVVFCKATKKQEINGRKKFSLAGGTPEDVDVIHYVIEEMKEEFGVVITQDNLTIHGITKESPHGDIEMPNCCLVVKVDTKIRKHVFESCWKTALDKEAAGLHFVKLDYENKKALLHNQKDFEISSLVYLEMILESEFGEHGKIETYNGKDYKYISFE